MEIPANRNPLICPVCHGENAPDAVFCANPTCGKALGEFPYVAEEVAAASSWLEHLADRITDFTGQPHFITVHVAWFVLWVLLNSGAVIFFSVFDAYPYALLAIILSIEAILLTGFLLITQNRQSAHAEKRAELDYEVNVRSYRKLLAIETTLDSLKARIESLEKAGMTDPRSGPV